MIANRKYIIDDLKAVLSGILRPAKFISTRVTADFIWEDPLKRLNSTIQILDKDAIHESQSPPRTSRISGLKSWS